MQQVVCRAHLAQAVSPSCGSVLLVHVSLQRVLIDSSSGQDMGSQQRPVAIQIRSSLLTAHKFGESPAGLCMLRENSGMLVFGREGALQQVLPQV
mmetsp:Transcript_119109/g.297179  ORF Transcript_119109/g.297179 Transcript_119109/m.297179 type:complete len:95 (+) Transcript_119109:915-1199(+)